MPIIEACSLQKRKTSGYNSWYAKHQQKEEEMGNLILRDYNGVGLTTLPLAKGERFYFHSEMPASWVTLQTKTSQKRILDFGVILPRERGRVELYALQNVIMVVEGIHHSNCGAQSLCFIRPDHKEQGGTHLDYTAPEVWRQILAQKYIKHLIREPEKARLSGLPIFPAVIYIDELRMVVPHIRRHLGRGAFATFA